MIWVFFLYLRKGYESLILNFLNTFKNCRFFECKCAIKFVVGILFIL